MIFKCKMCGGDIVPIEGTNIGNFEYCKRIMTLPNLDNEKKVNLYNRANDYRLSNDFDKAHEIYEKILEIDNKEIETEKIKIEAETMRVNREKEGYSYNEERRFDVADKVADNKAVGQYTNMGVGLGMISGITSSVGDKVHNEVVSAFINPNGKIVCSNCNTGNERGSKFCKRFGNKLETKYAINVEQS